MGNQAMGGFIQVGQQEVGRITEPVVAQIDDFVGQGMEMPVGSEQGGQDAVISFANLAAQFKLQRAATMFGQGHVGIGAAGKGIQELAPPLVVQAYGAVDVDTLHASFLRVVFGHRQKLRLAQGINYAAAPPLDKWGLATITGKTLVGQKDVALFVAEKDKPDLLDFRVFGQGFA